MTTHSIAVAESTNYPKIIADNISRMETHIFMLQTWIAIDLIFRVVEVFNK